MNLSVSESKVTETIKSTCAYCGVGCGVEVTKLENGAVDVKGDVNHPANFGRLCSKGSRLGDTLSLNGRLLEPEVDGQKVSWKSALDTTAGRFKKILEEHGPESVAFYVSGQMLTEDYYVANKLMKGYIGSANIDTNSRLCMAASVAAHSKAFGYDSVPGCYEDLELADLIVIVGSNLSWCHPVLALRIADAGKDRKIKTVVVDPRKTETCDTADLHLPINSGTDTALFNGLLHYLKQHDHLDFEFLENHTSGFGAAFQAAEDYSIPKVSEICAVHEEDVASFYSLFARTEKVVTVFAQGVHQSSSGVDKINSIINCHLATGRIGKSGAGPFSLTGQINAMGGREVGGLANHLAAHMKIENADHRNLVQKFWNSPTMAQQPGLKAVQLFQGIASGQIKAVWIMATNPLVSLPEADLVRQALQKCPLVIVSENIKHTDTTAYAHILLPAAAWGEKDGTVTNSERCISRQRAFLPLPGQAKPDWWIICQIAQRLGFTEGFSFESPAAIFREHAALSGYCNQGKRDFDISGLSEISDEDFQIMKPQQWPILKKDSAGTPRLFTDKKFYTSDQRAQLVPIHPKPRAKKRNTQFPLVLNTGRIRDQWHTMTRTGKAPRLLQHLSEPFVEVASSDAELYGLKDKTFARITTESGEFIARVQVSERQKRNHIFVPFHWTRQFVSEGPINALVNAEVDPASGQPEFKHTPAAIDNFPMACQGFIISRQALSIELADYWVKVPLNSFYRYEIADHRKVPEWIHWFKKNLGIEENSLEWFEYFDPARQNYRGAWVENDRLNACVFFGASSVVPSRLWLESLFNKENISRSERLGILSGVPPAN